MATPGDAEEVRVSELASGRRNVVQELSSSGVDQGAAICIRTYMQASLSESFFFVDQNMLVVW